MKNGSVPDKLRMQERELKAPKQNFADEKKKIDDTTVQQQISTSVNQSINNPIIQ